MNIIERLISGYPQGDVSPQDFIDHLSIGADGWVGAWGAVGLAVIFGIQIVCFYVGLNLLALSFTTVPCGSSGYSHRC